MDNKITYLKQILDCLNNPNQESLDLSMNDVHHDGVFSLVIKGTEFGKLTRIFIAHKKIKPFAVQLHTHRYDLKILTISGNIKHHLAQRNEPSTQAVSLSGFNYKSPLNGGSGLSYLGETIVELSEYNLPIGSAIQLNHNDFHTMSCSKNSIWIVEEQGFVCESSMVLGVPFITEGLYRKPSSFQINDNVQLVIRKIRLLLSDYKDLQNSQR